MNHFLVFALLERRTTKKKKQESLMIIIQQVCIRVIIPQAFDDDMKAPLFVCKKV